MVTRRFGPGLLLVFVCTQGCYLLRQGFGHLSLLSRARPIEEVIREGRLSPEQVGTLRYIQEVKAFGETKVGLRKTQNYTTFYDAGEDPVSWAVSASRKDRFVPFRWNFPVIGPATYKGFFDRREAEEERAWLEQQGMDAIVRKVPAYSTLGYFKDPVTSHQLKYSRARLADLILHELVHSTIFVPGHTPFNESLASFVASKAGKAFLEERFGPDSEELKEFRAGHRRALAHEGFVRAAYGLLDALYRSGWPRREILRRRRKLLDRLRGEYRRVVGGSVGADWNNAVILANRTYHRSTFWKRIFARAEGDWGRFFDLVRSAVRAGGDPFAVLEQASRSAGFSGQAR